MEKPLYAMLTLANATTVGADPVSADTVLEGVTAEAVKEAGMAAVKSELSVGAVGNISEVRCPSNLQRFRWRVFWRYYDVSGGAWCLRPPLVLMTRGNRLSVG